tara:strand:- start:2266 stop:2388 length:123 start_codon:yes stop_codon:yes gene_type:complete
MMINKYTQGEAISEATVILLVGIISKSFLKIKTMKSDSEE